MRSKFFTLTLASAAMAAVALSAIPAVATTTTRSLKVPFSFTVNGKECPAGVYLIQRDVFTNIVRLQSKDASKSFTWIAGPSAATNAGSAILSFDQIGDKHVLRSVQSGSLETHRLDSETMKSKAVTVQVTPGQ